MSTSPPPGNPVGPLGARLSMALFSPSAADDSRHASQGGSPSSGVVLLEGSPRAAIDAQRYSKSSHSNHARVEILRKSSPPSSNTNLGRNKSASPTQHSGHNNPTIRRQSFIQDVLSTTPASISGSDNPHDKVKASELTPIIAGLELQTDEFLPIFEYYCSYGNSYNLELLKLTNFLRFIKDSGCLPGVLDSEVQLLFVRSTRAVTLEGQRSEASERKGHNGGAKGIVLDNTCLTYANWLESICRIAKLRLDARKARIDSLTKICQHKKRHEENPNIGANIRMIVKMKALGKKARGTSKNKAAYTRERGKKSFSPEEKTEKFGRGTKLDDLQRDVDDLEQEVETLRKSRTDLSSEVDKVVDGFIMKNCQRLPQLSDAVELLEERVTEVIRSDLPNLEVIFAYYSDAQRKEEALIGEAELNQFAFDFGLMPRLLTKLELFRIFRKVSDGRFNLGFPDFLECVGRAALTAFNKPYFATAYPSNAEKVAGFLQWLEDSGYQRKIMEHDRLRGHGSRGRQLTSLQLLGARASEETGLKPSQAMLRRLTETKNRSDISSATKQRAHEEAFAFTRNSTADGLLADNNDSPSGAGSLRRVSSIVISSSKKRFRAQRQKKRRDREVSPKNSSRSGLSKDKDTDDDGLFVPKSEFDVMKSSTNPFRVEKNNKVLGPKIASSIFSPHWGSDRLLMRAVSALEPYQGALLEVFEYYCFYNNRKKLNVTELSATNWAKLCRDCHLVLDPRGVMLNQDASVNAMEKSGCWVTPGEVDVVFVKSCKSDSRISGVDHSVLTFDTFQLALARLARVIDKRAGENLRNYHHEFSNFEDKHITDFAYYAGDEHKKTREYTPSGNLFGKDEANKHHTSLSIKSVIQQSLRIPDSDVTEGREGKAESLVDSVDEQKESLLVTKANSENTAATTTTTTTTTATPENLHMLDPQAIDQVLLQQSISAVDTGGAMTSVHGYDKERIRTISLAEALALLVSHCILPHASRMTFDGYGKKEALQALKVLSHNSVINIIQEERRFMEKLFLYYAEIRDEKILGVVVNKHAHSAVSFAEIMEFGKDFGLLPSLATQTELFMCFRSSRRNPQESKDRATMLLYPEFVECLSRIGLVCFSKPYLNERHPDPQHKIHGFFGWLRASNGLKKIQTYEWVHGRGRGGVEMTQKIFQGGTTELKTRQKEIEEEHRARVDNEYTRLDTTMQLIRKCSRKKHGRHLDLSSLFEKIDEDGNGQINKDEFIHVLSQFIPSASEQEDDGAVVIINKEDLGNLYEYFDSDGDGGLQYTEFAYQFYNRGKVSNRLKAKQQGDTYMRHSHRRGSIAEDTGELMFDMDFVDNMTGDKPLTRTEVARLQSQMRKVAYSYSGMNPLKFFAMVDSDNNGILDFSEFEALMNRIQGRFRNEDFEKGVDAMSTNKGHKIGAKIFADKITKKEIKFIFDLIDTDQSGTISVQELSDFLKENNYNSSGTWKNAMDMARMKDLLEHERKRQAYIVAKEKAGRVRLKERKKAARLKRREERRQLGDDTLTSSSSSSSDEDTPQDVAGPLVPSHNFLAKKKEERLKRRRKNLIEQKTKLRMKKYKAPTIGTMLNYEEHSQKRAHQRVNSSNNEKAGKGSSVWDQSLQDVPKLFRKTPGEDKTIRRLRQAKAKADDEKMKTQHRKYTPIKYRSSNHLKSQIGHQPDLHGWEDFETKRKRGRQRRAAAEAAMQNRLSKRPIYLSSMAKNAKESEAASVSFRTSKSIPAKDRLKQGRREKITSYSKREALKRSSSKVEQFLGFEASDEVVSAVNSAIGTDDEFTELEALAFHSASQYPGDTQLKDTNPARRRKEDNLQRNQSIHRRRSLKKRADESIPVAPQAVSGKSSSGNSSVGKQAGKPSEELKKKNNNNLSSSMRRGSYFGMTTHGTTQRRKAQNKAKLAGYANEYGQLIRPHKKYIGDSDDRNKWTHPQASHARSGGYAGADHSEHHSKKRVKKRTAFGSTVITKSEPTKTTARKLTADDAAVLSIIASPTHASKKKHLQKGQGSATAEALQLEKDKSSLIERIGMKKSTSKSSRKHKHSHKHKRKHKTPHRKQASGGIIKGWSPAVIRGTSVTAHTHSSSSSVLAAPHHNKLKDSISVSEEQLEPLAVTDDLF